MDEYAESIERVARHQNALRTARLVREALDLGNLPAVGGLASLAEVYGPESGAPNNGNGSTVSFLNTNTTAPLEVTTLLDPNFVVKPKDYIVEGLLEPGDAVLLTGMWGAGKSTFALALGLAVANPRQDTFLGMDVLKHGVVLYADQENPADEMAGRVRRLMGDGVYPAQDQFVLSSARPLSLQNPDDRTRLFATVDTLGPTLVVLDSYVGWLGDVDQNAPGDMRRVFNEGIYPILQRGVAVVILEHPPKSHTSNASPNTSFRGSGDKGASSGRLWQLDSRDPVEATRTLSFGRASYDRFMRPVGYREVWTESGLSLVLEDLPEGEEDFSEVVEALRRAGGPVGKGQLARTINRHETQGMRRVDKAEAAGVVRFEADPHHSQRVLVALEENDLSLVG